MAYVSLSGLYNIGYFPFSSSLSNSLTFSSYRVGVCSVQNEGTRRGLTPDMLNSGFRLLRQQFYALFVKRIIYTLRNKGGAFTQLFWPGLFTLFGLIATKVIPTPGNSPMRAATYSSYGATTLYYGDISSPQLYSGAYTSQFNGSSVSAVDVTGESWVNSTDFGDYLRNETDAEGQNGIANFNKHHITGTVFDDDLIMIYFNNVGFHAVSESLAAVSNALLRSQIGNVSMTVTNHPLPRTAKETVDQLRL